MDTDWISRLLGALCSTVSSLEDFGPRTTKLTCRYEYIAAWRSAFSSGVTMFNG